MLIDSMYIAAPQNLPVSVIFGLLGLLFGSFLNVVIYRLPKMMQHDFDNYVAGQQDRELPHPAKFNLMVPRSACPHCGHAISAMENIPIISYLMIRGRCVGCKAPISPRYPLIESLTGLISIMLIWHFGSGMAGMASLLFAYFLIAMAAIDFDTQLLPDDLTLPLLWLGLVINSQGLFCSLEDAVFGAVFGYLSLWSIYWIFKLLTGKEGMGYGDFKLLAALGAWCGWIQLPVIILISSLMGAVIGLIMIWRSKLERNTPFSFGPYLALAGLIALPFGPVLTRLYLGSIS